MGADQIAEIIMPFTLKDPLTNGIISPDSKGLIDSGMGTVNVAGASKPVILSAGNDPGAWYITGANRVDPARWASNMVATRSYATQTYPTHPVA